VTIKKNPFLLYPDKRSLDLLKLIFISLVASFYLVGNAEGHDDAKQTPQDLVELSLEELMDIKVTSVSKKEQKLSQAAAAIFVISQEDIRRSGVTTIPEALRMAPGVEVAQVDANKWAITIRGFNNLFSSKLLVMIDGRTVYSPLFSGVYWDVQDTVLEDIDRIEVIRGPGGTLWGANAVNGVINIITKNARDTQGGMVTAGGGTLENGFGSIRYGGKMGEGEKAHYRVFAKYFNRDSFDEAPGADGADEWEAVRGGFRMDLEPSENNSWTIQGDYYDGESGQRVTEVTSLTAPFLTTTDDDVQVKGTNLLARWKHSISERSRTTLQVYYDRAERDAKPLKQTIDTFDMDFHHHLDLGEHHDIVWGVGQRFVYDDLENTFAFSFTPDNRLDHTTSAFIQDDITLIENRLRLTLGSKFEWNSYTEFEYQPNARILWTPHPNHSVWASVSRAVRTPARTDDSFRLNFLATPGGGLNNLFSILGNNNLKSEDLVAYELGYRLQPTDRIFLDVATFFNSYDSLISQEPLTPFTEPTPPPTHLTIASQFQNKLTGKAYGVEIAGKWKVFDWWELNSAFNWFQFDLDLTSPSADTSAGVNDGNSPKYQFNIRSHLKLPHHLEFDTALFVIDELDNLQIPSYNRLDARIGWLPTDSLEMSLVFQNLLDPRHKEFGGSEGGSTRNEVPRSAYGKVVWKF
jgi:iron complex outermembrane receptor protein